MSKKSKHIDVLGEAHLPADLLTFDDSYGFKGYADMQYGLGVLEGDAFSGSTPSPEHEAPMDMSIAKGEGNGFFDEPDNGPDFTEFMHEARIQDLNWLELNEQDIDRLPKNTEMGTAIPELEEAWGVHRRTNGLYPHHSTDLERARYEVNLKQARPQYKHSKADLIRVVRRAMRRSAVGYDLTAILTEAAEALGEEAPRIRTAMKRVQDEHGLAGNVFIRAAAFPGIEQGKWAETLKGLHARYIIMDEQTRTGSVNVYNSYFKGKRAVSEVPWSEALDHYRDYLIASGRPVPDGDPRVVLRSAFLSLPERKSQETNLPTHKTASERITRQAAWAKFNSAPVPNRKIYTTEQKHAAQKRAAAWVRIQSWVDAGLVPLETAMGVAGEDVSGEDMLRRVAAHITKTKDASTFSGLANDVRLPRVSREAAHKALQGVRLPEAIDVSHRPVEAKRHQAHLTLARWVKAGLLAQPDARRLAKSDAPPLDVLQAASALVTASKGASAYTGVTNDTRTPLGASRGQVWATLKQAEKKTVAVQATVDSTVRSRRAKTTRASRKNEQIKGLVAKIETAIDKGVRGAPLRDLILRTIPRGDVKIAAKYLDPVLRDSGALNDMGKTAHIYRGPVYRPVAHKVAGVNPHIREVGVMTSWTRKALQEGFAGKDLDALLEAKFSQTVRDAGSARIAELRSEHEGGAGFIYVDAAAYASETGTKGCDAGALKHRANGLRYVLGMSRCASCSIAQVAPDGCRICGKYNKQIITAADLPEEAPAMRAANIKAANMSDPEVVASMFAPGFDEDEFNLHNTSLEDFEFKAAPDNETLGEILFGGMEW